VVTRQASRGVQTGRRPRRLVIALVVVIIVLVGLDFGAKAVAESVMASKIQQQGLTNKPDVSIGGFPFLTQVASKDFSHVSISDTNQVAGPVTITSFSATASGIKLNSFAFSSGTIGALHGTALISFSSLGNTLANKIGPLGSLLNGAGLNLTAAGPDEVKMNLNLLVVSGSATWRVTRLSGNRLNIRLVSSSSDLPSDLLSSIQDVTVQIPKLPLGLTIDSFSVTSAGVVGQISGQNVPFGS
jgi:LmeA-like phospholipid-binding